MSPAATIDEYLAPLPADQRAALQKLRATIASAAPDAAESISYGVPTFKYKGRPLVNFGAAKKHCALYGMAVVEADRVALEGFDTSKGTIRFTPDKPLPTALVKKLVKARMKKIEANLDAGKGVRA
jgi:uncharacterized protein YdhG (YjbR/CyaY superfamily)